MEEKELTVKKIDLIFLVRIWLRYARSSILIIYYFVFKYMFYVFKSLYLVVKSIFIDNSFIPVLAAHTDSHHSHDFANP